MPFELLILSMLNMLKRTLSVELTCFFEHLKRICNRQFANITPSAFTQSRHKLSPDVFLGMNQVLIEEYYSDNDSRVKLWKNHRLLGVDGSTIMLPYSEALKKEFGTHNNQKKTDDVIIARVSVLYDVLNDLVITGTLSPFKNGEVKLAYGHIGNIAQNDLIILDRAYPSFELAYNILEREADFLFRCKHNFSTITREFMQSTEIDTILDIYPGQKQSFKDKNITAKDSIKVRLIKIELSSGETELLMTSLINQEIYLYEEFKGLYQKRWSVETYYNRLKNILSVENFSGLTQQAILQDFACALFVSNVQSLIIEEAQEKYEKEERNRRYEYKINTSISLGFLKNRIIDLFIEKGPEKTLLELEGLLVENTIPIRKGRKFKRNPDKYRQRTKPPMFYNRKKNI
jgi:hypothetical protein